MMCWPAPAPAGAAGLVASLQDFKVRYAEARAKDHPELQQVYADKISAMKAAGEGRGCCMTALCKVDRTQPATCCASFYAVWYVDTLTCRLAADTGLPCPLLCTPDAEGRDAAAGDANRDQLVGLLDQAEQQLAQTPYLAGNAYSIADVMFTPVLFRLGMAGKTRHYLEPRPNVSAYYNRSAGT